MSEEKNPKKPIQVSREELHSQVWRTPMSRLAETYGISGNGLAKICGRMGVPYPPRGFWAKKAAGKAVTKANLPPADAKTLQSVMIAPTEKSPESNLPPKSSEALQKVLSLSGAIQIPERLAKPHPIIAGWLADRKRREKEALRERDPHIRRFRMPDPLTAEERRRHRVLHALFRELERNGASVSADGIRLYAKVSGETVEFQLREKQKQVRRPLTEDELGWHHDPNRCWRTVLEGTGKFAFTIKTYLPSGLRREWQERENKTIDALLPEIVATIIAAGPVLVERRKEREEKERLYQIEERRRAEERERQRLDYNRWRRLMEFADAWRNANMVREFLAVLKTLPHDDEQKVGDFTIEEWISWAEQRVERYDPISAGHEGIFSSIAKVRSWDYRE